MLEIKNLTKTFRTSDIETTALNEISLYIKKESLSLSWGHLVAENQRLLNIIGMLDNASEEQYLFDGKRHHPR